MSGNIETDLKSRYLHMFVSMYLRVLEECERGLDPPESESLRLVLEHYLPCGYARRLRHRCGKS